MVEQKMIFVTGATGFIGRHFLNELLAQEGEYTKIFVLVRNTDIARDDARIVCVKGDLRDIKKHAHILRQANYIFHLAANVNFFEAQSDDDKVNFESTRDIIDILKTDPRQLKNFIFVSTIGAVDRHKDDRLSSPLTIHSTPTPTTMYGQSKLKAETYLKESGLPFTIIRPTWVYGMYMRANSHINTFVTMVYRRSFVTKVHFPGRVSLIYVGDLVRAMVACMVKPNVIGKTYFAATEAMSIGAVFQIIHKEIFGTTLKQISVPRVCSQVVKRMHHLMPLPVANLFVDYLFADQQPFCHDFGIDRPTTFATGVRDVITTNTSVFKQVFEYTKMGYGFFGAWLKLSLYPVAFFKEVLPSSGVVLDLGCGEGMLTNLLAQAIPGVTMVGVDKDEKRITQAKQAALPRTAFLCSSIETAEMPHASAVIVNDVLHHHNEDKQRELVTRALTSLKPGGIFVLKEVDIRDFPDKWWTKLWDTLLYRQDTLHFRTPESWDKLFHEFGATPLRRFTVNHFWPASRTITVYKKI